MLRRRLGWLTLLVLGVLVLPVPQVTAASERPDDGVVIWNEDYTLAEDEELDGNLVVFNGDAALEPGSRARGDVVVWNGDALVGGIIEGNLVVSSGDILLNEDAHVRGDVVCTFNCSVEQEEGARVDGDLVEGPSLRGIPPIDLIEPDLWLRVPRTEPEPVWLSGPEQLLRWIFRLVRRVVMILVVAAMGGVVALIWPEATDQVGQAVFETPAASLGIGVLTVMASMTLVIALAITICLSPAAALLALALGTAGLFGWTAVGARVGERLLQALHARGTSPVWRAGLGTLIITLIAVGLSNAFCLSPLGWLLTFVVGCLGLGAVVLTRLGTTPYVPNRPRRPPTPASPPASTSQPEKPNVEGNDQRESSEGDASA
jgi:hypothetical protein